MCIIYIKKDVKGGMQMQIKVGDVYKIDDKYYVVTRKISKPYPLVKLHSVNEDEEFIMLTPELVEKLKAEGK